MNKLFLSIILIFTFFFISNVQAETKKAKVKSEKKTNVEKGTETGKKEKGKEKASKKEEKQAQPQAQQAPQAPADPKELAKKAYAEGKEYYEKGDYQKALDSFLSAYNYVPNPFVYISIAHSYDKLGKCLEARDYYLKYMKEKPDAGNIPEIKEKIAELEARKGKVTIKSEPDGASITVDGEVLELKTPATIELKGGDHALALNKDGYIMETKAFTVPICGEVEVQATLQNATPVKVAEEKEVEKVVKEVKEEKKHKIKIAMGLPHYIAFGVAGAAAVTAAISGGIALKKSNDFEDKKSQYEQNPSDEIWKEMDDIKSQGRPLAIVCDVAIGVAAVAAVTGVALIFVGPREEKEVSINPIITTQGGGASLQLNF